MGAHKSALYKNNHYTLHNNIMPTERMWGKRNTYSLLVGVQINIAIIQSCVEVPQRISNTVYLSYFTGHTPREPVPYC